MNDFGKILPSEFVPQLRDTPPSLKFEGCAKDYELPEIDLEDDLDSGPSFSSSPAGAGFDKET